MLSNFDKKCLQFTQINKFKDPFKGKYPLNNIKKDLTLKELNFNYDTFISCWHLSEYESAAMWDLYMQSDYVFAIQTTVKRLKESLKKNLHEIYFSQIKYIDYNEEEILDDQEYQNDQG